MRDVVTSAGWKKVHAQDVMGEAEGPTCSALSFLHMAIFCSDSASLRGLGDTVEEARPCLRPVEGPQNLPLRRETRKAAGAKEMGLLRPRRQ